MTTTKKITVGGVALALLFIGVLLSVVSVQAAAPSWNVNGNWNISMEYLSTPYTHDMTLTQDMSGNLTGSGGYPAGGAHTYAWTLTSGTVSGNTINFSANYTASADAVTPQTTLVVVGTVAPDGTMSGTWSDNYQGGVRAGTWTSVTGIADAILPGTLSGEDFGVVNYDTGLGMLTGYTAGFGLTDAVLAGATSVVVKLYSAGDVLLQTNTAILPKFNADITGNQFSSPFDVSGTFSYATDGYWTNVRESQYGQSVPATKVVATVTLANSKMVNATNTLLVGDPTTIYGTTTPTAPVLTEVPVEVTIPELSLYTFDANASDINGGTLIFSLSGAPTGSSINATTGVFAWTPGEAQGPGNYTFNVIVSDGALTDSQSITINVTEVTDAVTTPTNKNQCKNGGWMSFTNPAFKNQGLCVAYTNR